MNYDYNYCKPIELLIIIISFISHKPIILIEKQTAIPIFDYF